jgi:hypothetical protein
MNIARFVQLGVGIALLASWGCRHETPVDSTAATKEIAPITNAPTVTQQEPPPPVGKDGAPEVKLEKAGKGDPVRLRLQLEEPVTWRYTTNVDSRQVGETSFASTTEMRQTLTAKPNGDHIEVAILIDDVRMKAESPQDQKALDEVAAGMKGMKTVAQYDRQAQTRSTESSGGRGIAAMMAQAQSGVSSGLFGVILPPQPVAPGAEWVGRYDMTRALGNMARASGAQVKYLKGGSHPIRYRFVEVRKEGGSEVAVITFAIDGVTITEFTLPTLNQQGQTAPTKVTTTSRISGKGEAHVDLKTGIPLLVRQEQTSSAETQGVKTTTIVKSVTKRES